MSFRSTPEERLPASINVIALGRGISFLGDEVALLAMALRARYELGHFGVAAILIAGAVPILLLSPISGLMVDRLRTKPLLVVVTLIQAAMCVALAFSSAVAMVPLIALLACGTAIAGPAWQALVPTLVSEAQLPAAMGRLQGFTAIAQVAGPFVGGLLVARWGFHVPLVVDAVTFLALAAVPVVLRVDRVPAGADGELSLRESLAGVRIIFTSPPLRSLLVLVTTLILAIGVVNVVEIWFVTTVLNAGAFAYGVLGLSFGVGMLTSSMGAGALSRRYTRAERLFVAGCLIVCAAILCFGLTTQLWQACAVLFLAGVGNGMLNVNAGVLLATHTVDEFRGRVFSAVQATVSAAQIVALVAGGLLLLRFAPRTIILMGGALSFVAMALTVAPVLRVDAPSLAPAVDGGDAPHFAIPDEAPAT